MLEQIVTGMYYLGKSLQVVGQLISTKDGLQVGVSRSLGVARHGHDNKIKD